MSLILTLLIAGCTSDPGSDPSTGASPPASSPASGSATASPTVPPTGSSTVTGTSVTTAPPPATGVTPPPSQTPVTGTVTPVVTYSGFDAATGGLQAAAYVDGVQQAGGGDAGGTCTLTVTGPDGTTATGSRPAEADATTTQCGTVTVTPQPATPGTWSGVVSYSSATAVGSSAPFTVEVSP